MSVLLSLFIPIRIWISLVMSFELDSPIAPSQSLTVEARKVRDQVPKPAVVAHRGVPYFAPEETIPSYILARELGAHYLEADLQRTKDGVIVAFHDNDLKRTTNVEELFPERADQPISAFSWEELQQLDAGSWFNKAYPERACEAFVGLKIISLEQMIDIAEGGENKPGLYLETKAADMYPGIEKEIYDLLEKRGWVGASRKQQPVDFSANRVGVAYTGGRVVMQTFEKSSLVELNKYFKNSPLCFLLWKDDLEDESQETLEKWLNFGIKNGAQFIGTSIPGQPNNYPNLMEEWMVELIHEKGLYIHPYTFNTQADFEGYCASSEGQFTDRTDLLLEFYGRSHPNVAAVLEQYGFVSKEKQTTE